jgi:hypothetical protein
MLLVSFALGQVTIDGYAYLENQTDHGEITITFERTAPSALTEIITTDTDGYFTINLETGIYDVTYSKIEYFSESLIDQSLYSNVTLDPLTMIEHISLINVPSLFTTIQLAIDYASDGDTILVQPGTYEENINYSGKNIVIGSLYLTTQDTSYISSTIIDGSSAGTVVTFNSGEESTATLCGFTVQNGNANKGGGISCFSSSRPTLTNLRLIDNSSSAGGGGGLYCEVASPSLFNVVIKNNTAPNGGGIHFEHTPAPHPNLLNVEISNNVGTNLGGGIFLISSNPIISHSTIVNNSSPEGSGINNYSNASPVIRNSIIANNSGSWGINVQNNTSITYSTFYGNESGNIIGDTWVGQNMITNVNGDSCDIYFNIQEDPLFVDASVNNYNLQQTSPCIDAGDPISPYDADGSLADMGAYPSPYGTPVPIVIDVPNDYSTIQAGLNAANANDTVLVQPGTYYENIIWPETNGIKLMSAGDSSNTTIDGGGLSSVIYMNPQTATIDTTTLIQGFRITNGGNVSNGGGLFLGNIGLTFRQSKVVGNNIQGHGAGIYCNSSEIHILDGDLSFNSSTDGQGGGIYLASWSTAEIISSTIANNNSIWGGGGIYSLESNVDINNSKISSNSAINGGGGGVNLGTGSSSTISNTNISENTARSGGGITIESGGSGVIISNSVITRNLVTQETGGGILITNGSSPNISNTIIATNQAVYGGGVGVRNNATPTLSNVSIAENSATYGGGISVVLAAGYYSGVEVIRNVANESGNGIFVSNGGSNPSISNMTLSSKGSSSGFGGLYIESGNTTISQSNILSDGYSIYSANNLYISQALNNYWGHSSGPNHPSQNPSGQGDSVNTFVNVTPWLTTPNTDAPPIPAQNVIVTGTGNDFINLAWDPSPLGDFAGFKVYYDTDESGYPYDNSVDIGSSNTYALSGLNLGTEYFLAVTVYDTDGNESWCSNEVTGVTRVMEVQNLDIAGDEHLYHLVTHDPIITFEYFDSMGETQTNYNLQITTDSTFQTNIIWDSGEVASDATSIQYTGGALLDGVKYYLRAKVASGSFWSDWAELSFRMNSIPSTPGLISPIENLVVNEPIQLTISKGNDTESDPILYQYFVFDDNSREVLLDSSEWVSDTTWQITTTLTDNNQYWWDARSFDGFEMSELAAISSFLLNTENNVPGSFDLLYPVVNGETSSLQPLFLWTSAADPDPIDTVSYTLLLDSPGPGIITIDVGNDTTWQISEPLIDNTVYFWKVIAKDLLGFETENTDSYYKFTTNLINESPSIVDLYSPDSVIVLSLTPEMIWSPATDPDPGDMLSYELHWWGDGIEFDSVLTDTNVVMIPRELEDNTQYFWEVITMDNSDGISHSTEATFWTDLAPEAPSTFALLGPANDATGLSVALSFEWQESLDPDPLDYVEYILEVSADSTFELVEHEIEVGLANSYQLPVELTNDTEYWWRVTAMDTDSLETVSETFKLTVGYVSIVENLAVPSDYALQQNYPNPFNPTTTIRYGLPSVSDVTIVIYDITGREVKTLVNTSQSAGWYNIQWNGITQSGTSVSTGVYFARIQAGNYSEVIKMVYLR